MIEGEQLKNFIDNQPKSKISIARDLVISKQTLFQYFRSKELTAETKAKFEAYFGSKIFVPNSENGQRVNTDLAKDLKRADPKQPMVQIVLNLTYTQRKNADSIDKMAEGVNTMAATNRRSTEIIAALVSEMFPNSKIAAALAAEPAALHTDDDLPAEAFLNEAKADTGTIPKQKDKKTEKSR